MRAIGSMVLTATVACLLASPASAQEEPASPQPPVEFSGRVACGPPVAPDRSGTETKVEVGHDGMTLNRYRNGAWRQTATVSDPRLEGSWYHTWENDAYLMPGSDAGPSVAAATWRIQNDEGAWQGGTIQASFLDGSPFASGPTLLIGEGAYEGFSALMEVSALEGGCTADIRGIIFDDMPAGVPYDPE